MAADPVLIAYTAKRTKAGKSVWSRIGQAYPHEQGNGLTVVLDSIPLDGRIILLELDPADDDRLLNEATTRRPPRVRQKTSPRSADATAAVD